MCFAITQDDTTNAFCRQHVTRAKQKPPTLHPSTMLKCAATCLLAVLSLQAVAATLSAEDKLLQANSEIARLQKLLETKQEAVEALAVSRAARAAGAQAPQFKTVQGSLEFQVWAPSCASRMHIFSQESMPTRQVYSRGSCVGVGVLDPPLAAKQLLSALCGSHPIATHVNGSHHAARVHVSC